MRIQESDIRISSRHEQDYRHEVETRGEESFHAILTGLSAAAPTSAEGERERVARMLQSLVDAILAAMDGKKCRTEVADCRAELPQQSAQQPARLPVRELVWRRETTERISEHERTRVEGKGMVKTADGKRIDFSVGLDMCRDYACERKFEASGTVSLHDPLVINFDGPAAQLDGKRIDFDLDADGRAEAIPGLGTGSGYLVLDRNGNGKADDGSELFGTRSGDGFADLAALDSDGNGWLDEADADFAKLRVWDGAQAGSPLSSLADRGVGALWLGSTESPFAIKDGANRLLGEIRASGVYLHEDGRVGSLQQVDLAVAAKTAEA